MATLTDDPRCGTPILTEQEKMGSPVNEMDGLFVVHGRNYDSWYLAIIADNRHAASTYIREMLREHPDRTLDDYRLEVWSAVSEWPPKEE